MPVLKENGKHVSFLKRERELQKMIRKEFEKWQTGKVFLIW